MSKKKKMMNNREYTTINCDLFTKLFGPEQIFHWTALVEIAVLYADDNGIISMPKNQLRKKLTAEIENQSEKEEFINAFDDLFKIQMPNDTNTWLTESHGEVILGQWGKWYQVPKDEK